MNPPGTTPQLFSPFAIIATAVAFALIICVLWLAGEPLIPAWTIPLAAVTGTAAIAFMLWRQLNIINDSIQAQQADWQSRSVAAAEAANRQIAQLEQERQAYQKQVNALLNALEKAAFQGDNLQQQLQRLTADLIDYQCVAAFEIWQMQADEVNMISGKTTRTYEKLPLNTPQSLWEWLAHQPEGLRWDNVAATFPEQAQAFQAAFVLPQQIAKGKLLTWQSNTGEKGFFLLENIDNQLVADAYCYAARQLLSQYFSRQKARQQDEKIKGQTEQIAVALEQLRQKEASIQQLQQIISELNAQISAQKNQYRLLQDEHRLIYEGAPGGLAYFTAEEPIGLFYETDTQVRLLHQHLKLKSCNRQFARRNGQEQPQQMTGTRFETLFANPNGRDTVAILGQMLKEGQFAEETLEQDRDGNLYRCYKQYRAVKADNHLLGVLAAHLRFAKLNPDVSQAALRERQLRAWVTRQPVFSALADVSGIVKELTLALELFTALQKGQNIFTIIHPEDLAEVQQKYYAAAAPDSLHTFSARFRNKENDWREGDFALRNVTDEVVGGGIIIAIHDVTERNRQRRTARARIELLTATLDSVADPIAAIDVKNTLLYANPAMKALAGNGRLAVETLAHPPEIAAQLLYKGGQAEIRWRNQALQQTQRMETHVVRLSASGGGAHTVVHLHNVTRSREQTERLQLLVEKFSGIAMQTAAAIALCAPDGEIRWANAAFRQALGFAEADAMHLSQLADSQSDASPLSLLEDAITHPNYHLSAAISYLNAQGKTCWGEWTFLNLLRREALSAVLITLHECTHAKMQVEKLARHYRYTQAMLNATQQAIILADKEGRALLWTAAADFLQLREGQRIQRLHDADFWAEENGQTFRHRHSLAGEYIVADVENITPLVQLREALDESIAAEKVQVQHTCDVIARFEAIIAEMQTRINALQRTTDLAVQTAATGATAIAEARALLPEIAAASQLLPNLQHRIQDWSALLERYEEIDETTDLAAKLLEINAFRVIIEGDELPKKTNSLIASFTEKLHAIHQAIIRLQRLEPALK
ncbi:PAS domain-containing protein [Rhodoflexus sp.]